MEDERAYKKWFEDCGFDKEKLPKDFPAEAVDFHCWRAFLAGVEFMKKKVSAAIREVSR